ncbi:MAG: hypothetical protein KDD40_00740 [Bdellovibrionales bacterium]|nr:hypothetical protein [Bdellovibrionales bacterium]
MNKKYLLNLAKQKYKNNSLYDNHKLPNSRRDFIKLGLLTAGGYLLPSSIPFNAFAQTIQKPTIPFLVFDLAGGAGLPANFLVGQKGGPEDLCKDYRKHGWNPRANQALDTTFGVPMSLQNSKLLEGLRSTLPEAVLKQKEKKYFQMATICNFSLDDTSDNKASALTLVSKAGLVGTYLKTGLGQRPIPPNYLSDNLLEDSQFVPKLVNNLDDVLKLTSLGRRFLELDKTTKQEIRDKLYFVGKNFPELSQAYKDLSQFGDLHLQGDPTKSPEISEAYSLGNLNLQFLSDNENSILLQAGITYNVLQGFTGPGVISIGDCDYHDSTQDTGDYKDLEIGEAIGRAVAAAHFLKKPLFFQIITDGGVYAPGSDEYDRTWEGDENMHSLSVMGFYDPSAQISMRKLQLGHYTEGAEVDIETFVGQKPENMVISVMANYLYLNGLHNEFEKLTGIRMRASEIDDLLVFA